MTTEAMEKAALVVQARKVERLLARRRKVTKTLRDLNDEIRVARRFLSDLAMPTDAPVNLGEVGELLPWELRD